MNVGIEQLASGYIVTVAHPVKRNQQQQAYPSFLIFGMSGSEPEPPKVERYACKSLWEVVGLLEQLFGDTAFIANQIPASGELLKKNRTRTTAPKETTVAKKLK